VAQAVVDILEVVDIEEQQRQFVPTALGTQEELARALFQAPPGWAPGQQVEMRQVFDARLGQLALGDVARDAEHADGRAAGVEQRPLGR
jgi:hypothetical protein